MPEAAKSPSSPPRGGRSSSSAALSFPLPSSSPSRKLTSLASLSFFSFFLLLASASASAAAAASGPAPALGEALAFDSPLEPGAVRAFSQVERRAATACSSSAECRAACGVGGGSSSSTSSSSSSSPSQASGIIDWVSAPPSDLQKAREQVRRVFCCWRREKERESGVFSFHFFCGSFFFPSSSTFFVFPLATGAGNFSLSLIPTLFPFSFFSSASSPSSLPLLPRASRSPSRFCSLSLSPPRTHTQSKGWGSPSHLLNNQTVWQHHKGHLSGA